MLVRCDILLEGLVEMGLGDNLMATGFAKGAKDRGKRIAFGNGSSIIWDHHSEQIFRGNPNIAPPGSEGAEDLEWVPFYKTSRLYNHHDHVKDRWIWNYQFKPIPGEVYFHPKELQWAKNFGKGFVLIEPHVQNFKGSAPNKTWPFSRYQNVVTMLKQKGYKVRQFSYGMPILAGAAEIHTPSFRHALAVLSNAALYIGPEGGLHHGSAAVGIPAVVLFGGFIPPQVTGYDSHANLTGGATSFCGSLTACQHCIDAMLSIKSKHVNDAAKGFLECSTSLAGSGETSGHRPIVKSYSQASDVT